MNDLSPRQRRRDKNINTILDAARDLILKKGIENLSLRDIARKSDYSPSGLYKYFDSKQDIIDSLHKRNNDEMVQAIRDVQGGENFKEYLIQLCLMYIHFAIEHPIFLVLVNRKGKETNPEEPPVVPENSPYMFYYQSVQEWVVSESIKLSESYGVDEITYSIWAHIHGMATLRLNLLKDFKADFESINRRSIEIFLNGLSNQ
ncbi:MAG: TetR/AcrR family transcriptional regulator [Anaerolineae bacterium]|nr:TetR/AcrR family transcriptional regulator [Anaerolineae bacterium]